MSYMAMHEIAEQDRLVKMAIRSPIPDNGKGVRLIDANAIEYTLQSEPGGWGGEPQYIATKEEIGKMPTVDAVEVVYCVECEQWECPMGEFVGKCYKWRKCTHCFDFCSYGERRRPA